ncbi:BTB/POZ domain-containing protein KCTD14-like [Rhinoraja longicauda]
MILYTSVKITLLSKVVNLNVGGHIYTTTLGTLTRYPGSRLSEMFTAGLTKLPVDSKGRFFIDRKGTFFAYVLEFLRSLEPPREFVEEVHREALYYGIQPLVRMMEDSPRSYGEVVGRQNFLAQVANYAENIELIVRLARADVVASRLSTVVVCVAKTKEAHAEYLKAMLNHGTKGEPVVKFGPWDPSPTITDMLFCIKMDVERKGYKVSCQPYDIVQRPLSKPCNIFYQLIFTWW